MKIVLVSLMEKLCLLEQVKSNALINPSYYPFVLLRTLQMIGLCNIHPAPVLMETLFIISF